VQHAGHALETPQISIEILNFTTTPPISARHAPRA